MKKKIHLLQTQMNQKNLILRMHKTVKIAKIRRTKIKIKISKLKKGNLFKEILFCENIEITINENDSVS